MAQPERLALNWGALDLELCPAQGGSITRFSFDGRNVMRPATAAFFEIGDPREASSFPLVPFSNRIADGRLRFQGRSYELPKNMPPEPHAIHGQGWQAPWRVAASDDRSAELAFDCELAGTPFDYSARQAFTLTGEGLEIETEVTNRGSGAMPAGLGLHPYFERTSGVTMTAELDHVWQSDKRMIPKAREPLPPAWDFSRSPRIEVLEMDNCFGGWDGHLAIHWPESSLTLRVEADPLFQNLVVYIPPGQDFFCVEPVSHANNGFNMMEDGAEDSGTRVLAPGESLSGKVRFLLG